jgi:hypothetical protein
MGNAFESLIRGITDAAAIVAVIARCFERALLLVRGTMAGSARTPCFPASSTRQGDAGFSASRSMTAPIAHRHPSHI